MAGLVPLPHTVHHSSTRLTHLEAHTLLSSFLTEAETNPAYRPDATLTQSGPQALGVGAGSNLTLNHLNRILQGIAGKRIGGVEFNYGNGPPRKKRKTDEDGSRNQKSREDVVEMADGDDQEQAAIVGHETGDWQDKEDYEHAQVDETADLEGRDPADPGEDEAAPVVVDQPTTTQAVEVDTASKAAGGKGQTDKERRKQAKQARRKKERVDKNEKVKEKTKSKG